MQDMTQGSIRAHVLRMTLMMLAGMVMQTAYSLIDIYWVGSLGQQAVAAVGIASNLMFVVIGISQMLTVGTVALVSQAAGRKDEAEVQRLFNQSQSLSLLSGILFMLMAFVFSDAYASALASDEATVALVHQFMAWFVPAMALQFSMVGLGASLRGIGNMKPGLMAQLGSVLLNMVLAPFLIFGWWGLPAMGVAGAALATFIATFAALLGMVWYLRRSGTYLRHDFAQWKPDWPSWGRLLGIGLPAGAEFLVIAVILSTIYAVIKPFGADAQAGFGIGMRVMQAWFMPALCLSFAAAAVAGQNFGAQNPARVRETFAESMKMVVVFMFAVTVLTHIAPAGMIAVFSPQPVVVVFGAEYLRIVSYNYIASGLIMLAGGMFQGMGNTLPSLLASATRLLTFLLPAWWLSKQSGFTVHQVWYISVVSVTLQMLLVLWLLKREFAKRLPAAA